MLNLVRLALRLARLSPFSSKVACRVRFSNFVDMQKMFYVAERFGGRIHCGAPFPGAISALPFRHVSLHLFGPVELDRCCQLLFCRHEEIYKP